MQQDLGGLSGQPDPDHYDRNHAFADVLVVGSGVAGLSAALGAARDGRRVLLVENDERLGGRLLSERHMIDGQSGTEWVAAARDALTANPRVTVLTRTSLFGTYDGTQLCRNRTCERASWRQAHMTYHVSGTGKSLQHRRSLRRVRPNDQLPLVATIAPA